MKASERDEGGRALEASSSSVFCVAADMVKRLAEGQLEAIGAAARMIAGRLLVGGSVYVFGTGHSRAVAMELAGRAGGLEGFKELAIDDLVVQGVATRDELVDGTLERRPDAAQYLLSAVTASPADAFVIVSHSGCNGAPVEMALQAHRWGLPVVAITSLEHSRSVASRHPCGSRLFEVADLCIDTCAPYGDTAIALTAGLGICGVSSFAGVLVAQALTAEVVSHYLHVGRTPPLLTSRNLQGYPSAEHAGLLGPKQP